MKNLELKKMSLAAVENKLSAHEMEEIMAGSGFINYGDLSCTEFWTGISIAATGASWYAAAVNPFAGGIVAGIGIGASLAGMAC